MKKLLLLFAVVAIAVVGAGLSLGAKPLPPPPPPPYSLRLLTNEFGGDDSALIQLNDWGDAFGYAENATGGNVAFVSVPEARAAGTDMVDIQQLLIDGGFYDPTPGQRSGWFLDGFAGINNARHIAVNLHLAQNDQSTGIKPAYLRLSVTAEGVVTIAEVVDLSDEWTDAHGLAVSAINNNGDIVGHAWVPDANSATGSASHLMLYTLEFGWRDLGTIDPGVDTGGRNISDRDESASVYITGDGNWRLHYNIPSDQTLSVVRLQGTYATNPYAYTSGVNKSGMVAGLMATGNSDERAFLYDGTMKNLGSLTTAKSWNDSWARAVNDSGITVGGSLTGRSPGNSGLIYIYSTGKTFDMANCLNAADKAIYKDLAYWRADSNELSDINASGVICGPGLGGNFNVAGKRAYLLTPVSP
jgi:probable HAF family extracellular repeat protein